MINQYKFSREMFSNVKVSSTPHIIVLLHCGFNNHFVSDQVLGQVDKKFIACVLDSCGKGKEQVFDESCKPVIRGRLIF